MEQVRSRNPDKDALGTPLRRQRELRRLERPDACGERRRPFQLPLLDLTPRPRDSVGGAVRPRLPPVLPRLSGVHWNLPSNPVEFKQREGRVYRRKGHAVRKNSSRTHREPAMNGPDPWAAMPSKAVADRAPCSSDLVLLWFFPIEGGAQIDRNVLVSPSAEIGRSSPPCGGHWRSTGWSSASPGRRSRWSACCRSCLRRIWLGWRRSCGCIWRRGR